MTQSITKKNKKLHINVCVVFLNVKQNAIKIYYPLVYVNCMSAV